MKLKMLFAILSVMLFISSCDSLVPTIPLVRVGVSRNVIVRGDYITLYWSLQNTSRSYLKWQENGELQSVSIVNTGQRTFQPQYSTKYTIDYRTDDGSESNTYVWVIVKN